MNLTAKMLKDIHERVHAKLGFKVDDATVKEVADSLGLDPDEQLAMGLEVEQEHGPSSPAGEVGNLTGGSKKETGQIAAAHLAENPEYYSALAEMEGE